MDREAKQAFTRRLTQCNRGEMIVIIYDIFFSYEEDVRESHGLGDFEGYRAGIHRLQETLTELMGSLDFSYEISRQLHALYRYCSNQLSRSLYENRLDGLEAADRVMRRLYTGFTEVAKQDESKPLMRNVQQVYAGITYGRNDLNENCVEDLSRGFFV